MLSKDYVGLVRAFSDTGFVGSPIEWRAKEADPWQLTHPDGDTTQVTGRPRWQPFHDPIRASRLTRHAPLPTRR